MPACSRPGVRLGKACVIHPVNRVVARTCRRRRSNHLGEDDVGDVKVCHTAVGPTVGTVAIGCGAVGACLRRSRESAQFANSLSN
jgi:hypothetical protein